MGTKETSTAASRLPIRRNTILLSSALAANSAMLQLQAAIASITLVLVLDVEGLLGLGPAIVLATGAFTALPAGRAMDRVGRIPVLVAGFASGAVGCVLAAVGSRAESAPLVLGGLLMVGAASGIALLARTAAGDMYPPERRARGIAFVLFGAVFGAILGPAVFSPLVAGKQLDGDAVAPLWLAAGGFMVVAIALVAAVRPDPRRIAELIAAEPAGEPGSTVPAPIPVAGAAAPVDPHGIGADSPARPGGAAAAGPQAASLRELLGRRGVVPALIAAQASFAVMVGLMTLTGAVVVDHNHHEARHVFPIIGAHVVGMYALVIVVGDVIDRIGRTPALAGGLLLMGAAATGLGLVESVAATAVVLFVLGLGWNLSFVAATAELADRTEPWERGKLLGFNDFLSGITGAVLALAGGAVLTGVGVGALAAAGTVLVLAPAAWILREGRVPARSY